MPSQELLTNLRTQMNKIGAKGKANKKNNAELQKIFSDLNINFCEVCGSRIGLTYAHSQKRRFIQTDEEMKQVALLCLKHHQEIERLPRLEMRDRVTEIISNRMDLSFEAA